MPLSENEIRAYEGMEISEIREILKKNGTSPEQIRVIISEIDEWRIDEEHYRIKRKQGLGIMFSGLAIMLSTASIFFYLWMDDNFRGKNGILVCALFAAGYVIMRKGRTMIHKEYGRFSENIRSKIKE
jgi:hypothetical protein